MSDDFETQHQIETYRSLMTYGAMGLRYVLVVNGAAVLSVLTFLGHFVSADTGSLPDLRGPLALFVSGVVFGGTAVATAYMTQLSLFNETVNGEFSDSSDPHRFWMILTIVLLVFGILASAAGALWGAWSLT